MRAVRAVGLVALASGCLARPGFDSVTEADLPGLGQALPRGFFWGASTAGGQVEGGLTNNWTQWEAGTHSDGRPHIKNRDSSRVAADSWNRFDEDVAALRQLGATMYRMSVEWSRIEPSPGMVDQAALQRYVAQVRALKAAGITPMVCLQHFTLPVWAAEKGGFESDEVMADLERFVRTVAPVLGPEVDWWLTLNEPNVYLVFGYIIGDWPPGVKDRTDRGARVYLNMLKAHARMAAALRELDTVDADGDGHATRISIGHHVRSFLSASPMALDQYITSATEDFFNEVIPRALTSGRVSIVVPGTITLEETVPGLAGSADFLGVQYYSRYVLRADLGTASLSTQTFHAFRAPPDRPSEFKNDLGWEIYPDGLYEQLKRLAGYGLPLFITENGVPDGAGRRRTRFLAQHLAATRQALAEGVDVRGYLHWSLMDNFEWAEGYDGKFGLFRVDTRGGNLARVATPTVEPFRQVGEAIPR